MGHCSALLVQHAFSLIRRWPLPLGRGRMIFYTRRELGTLGEKTLCTTVPQESLPTCALSGLEPPTYHILGCQH